jgi:hypothetical protein
MRGPAREPDNGPSNDGPSDYAPKKLRHPTREPIPAGGADRKGDAAQNAAPESTQPPWKRSKRHGPFAGDVAIVELRNKLTLVPHQIPEPPPPPSTGMKYRLVIRLAGAAVVTAVGVVGYHFGSSPPQNQQVLTLPRLVPAAHPLQSAALPTASPPAARTPLGQSNEQQSRDAASSRALSGRLAIGAVQPQRVDESVRLMVSATDAGAAATVLIGGLLPGWQLSAGRQVSPGAWRLSVEQLTGATITPPRGFVGAADLTLELRLADNTVADRKSLRLEWSGSTARAPAESQPRRLEASEIAEMVKSGSEYMANGSIGAARMMFLPAAEAGDPVAAFALAETYDPLVLRKLNAKGGITADVGLAQAWYQKARDLGSAVAPERLDRLARVPE